MSHDVVFRSDETASWAALAALRFFLALVVVLGHSCVFVAGRGDWSFIGLWLNQGSAVFGFFVLSGYSIAASLERDSTGFYRRRVVRIWPTYLACLVVGVAVSALFPHGLRWPTGRYLSATTIPEVVVSAMMLQTICGTAIPVVGQIWSLSPEWWHYMLAPLLRRLSSAALACWLGLSFEAFMLIHPPAGGGPEGFTDGLGFLTLSWLWITGFLYRRIASRPVGPAILIFPSLCALFFGHFTGAPLFITLFVLLLSPEFKLPMRQQKLFNWAGDVSYPLYLFHMPVLAVLASFGCRNTALLVTASLGVSLVALYGVDYPCRRRFGTAARRNIVTISA